MNITYQLFDNLLLLQRNQLSIELHLRYLYDLFCCTCFDYRCRIIFYFYLINNRKLHDRTHLFSLCAKNELHQKNSRIHSKWARSQMRMQIRFCSDFGLSGKQVNQKSVNLHYYKLFHDHGGLRNLKPFLDEKCQHILKVRA